MMLPVSSPENGVLMKTEDLIYRDGALDLNGFVAYDDTRTGRRPGVLVVHEAWGFGEHAMERAKKLADLGYVALAADLYGGRKFATGIDDLRKLVSEMMTNRQKLRTRARAALTALAGVPQVDTTRLGAIGFCFGGTTVLELARDSADLRGVVSFHGGLETTMPAKPGEVKAKVLVCTGAEDPIVPQEHVNGFQEEMRKAGADWQVITYGNAGHSFTNPAADGSIGPHMIYHAPTDQRSWAAMQSFLAESFAP